MNKDQAIEKTIQKAVSEGYKIRPFTKIEKRRNQAVIFFDPDFWKCLCNSLELFGSKCYACANCKQDIQDNLEWLFSLDGDPCPMHLAMYFMGNLFDGKDAASFFESLLNN